MRKKDGLKNRKNGIRSGKCETDPQPLFKLLYILEKHISNLSFFSI